MSEKLHETYFKYPLKKARIHTNEIAVVAMLLSVNTLKKHITGATCVLERKAE